MVYADYGNNMFYLKANQLNKYNGYVYINIHCKDGIMRSRRLHRLLAKAYIPNPNNYPYVMHIDNNKQNYSLENLKWGTESENTKQAYDDGLARNDKGFEDSQSIPVDYYDLYTTKKIKSFGSLREAAKELDIELTSIIQSCDNKYLEVKKPYYFRYAADGNINIPRCIGAYNYDTDELFGMYYNCQNAADETGYSISTISNQVNKNRKPKRKFNNIYFLAIYRN